MKLEEKIKLAQTVRERDQFGLLTKEELDALPGENETYIETENGYKVHVFIIGKSNGNSPLVINFHGGGFIKGRSNRDRRYASTLMKELDCVVWDVDYSLAPEHPFPYALNEVYEICLYVFENANKLRINRDKIILAGHSAGGNLVASTLIKNAHTKKLNPLCALMEYFPTDNSANPADRLSNELRQDPFWVKRAQTEKLYTDFYVGDSDPKDPLCSPMFASDDELASFPDSLIISAGEDSLRDETESFASKLIENGVCVTAQRFKSAKHGFTVNRTPEWEKAVKLHIEFMKERINK